MCGPTEIKSVTGLRIFSLKVYILEKSKIFLGKIGYPVPYVFKIVLVGGRPGDDERGALQRFQNARFNVDHDIRVICVDRPHCRNGISVVDGKLDRLRRAHLADAKRHLVNVDVDRGRLDGGDDSELHRFSALEAANHALS